MTMKFILFRGLGSKYDFYFTIVVTLPYLSVILCMSYSRTSVLSACTVFLLFPFAFFSFLFSPRVIDSRQHYSHLCPVESTLLAFYIILLVLYFVVFLFVIWDTAIFLFLLYQKKGEISIGIYPSFINHKFFQCKFSDFQFISLFLMLYHFFQFISLLFYIAFSCFFKQKVCTKIFHPSLVTTPMQIFRFSVYITFSNVISLFSVYITFILYCFFLFFQTKVVYKNFSSLISHGSNGIFSIFSLYHFFQCYITFFSLYRFYFILLFLVFSNKSCVQKFLPLISPRSNGVFRFSVYITFSNGISLFSVYITFILYCFFMFFQTKSVYNYFLLSLVTGPNANFSIFSLYHFF
jgi:hypothetical protein